MKHAGVIYRVFAVAAVVLLCTMCTVVASEYTALVYCGRYALCSAPPWVAFYMAIPFAVAVGVCLFISLYFRKKSRLR